MRLIKVKDNKNRPVNNLDIMMGAVFGIKPPSEFIPGKLYQADDRVYTVGEDNRLQVWICNFSGTFQSCSEPNFTEWSLNSVIEENLASNKLYELGYNPIMYECKSAVSDCKSYLEYDGYGHFSTKIKDFDINNYQGPNDIVDVYLRREYSDHYLGKNDYMLNGDELLVELPLTDIADENNYTSNFLPEGSVVTNTDDIDYWYGEDGAIKTLSTVDGINIRNFDILKLFNESIEYGYKVFDIRIDAIHTLVPSPLNKNMSLLIRTSTGEQLTGTNEQTMIVYALGATYNEATPQSLENNNVFRLDEFIVNHRVNMGTDIEGDIQRAELSIVIEAERKIEDTLIVEFNKKTQLVSFISKNGLIKQVKVSIIAKKDKPLSVFMVGSKARSEMTKFIKCIDEYGEILEINGEHLVRIPSSELLRHNSFEFELYVNRVYRSDYEEIVDAENGTVYIKLLDTTGIDWEKDKFLFHMFYSISQGASIIKTSDKSVVKSEKDAFRIFLTTQFINKYQWLKLREDSKLIPPEVVVGSKNTANITDMNYYLSNGQTLKADVFTLATKNFIRRPGSETNCVNSESYPILSDTRDLIIPFIDYDSESDDMLIFKSGGTLISSAKWYLQNDHIKLYEHEYPLYRGSYLDFRLLDRDENVRVDNIYITATNKNQRVINVGRNLNEAAFILLFTMSGEYICSEKYSVSNEKIILKTDCNMPFVLNSGERVEIIIGSYTSKRAQTLYSVIKMEATSDDQTEFMLDDSIEYNTQSDNVLLFREDGMYIGERFYSINALQRKITLSGSPIPKGSYIEALFIRNLSVYVTPTEEDI